MARAESLITIDDAGTPLQFRLVQMSATALEWWMYRAVKLLAAAGTDVPSGMDAAQAAAHLLDQGPAILARLVGGMDVDGAKALLDELLACAHRVLDNGTQQQVTLATMDGYISDVRTIFKLRVELLKHNFAFLVPAVPSKSPKGATAKPTSTT